VGAYSLIYLVSKVRKNTGKIFPKLALLTKYEEMRPEKPLVGFQKEKPTNGKNQEQSNMKKSNVQAIEQ
jgi:hypothetical protein